MNTQHKCHLSLFFVLLTTCCILVAANGGCATNDINSSNAVDTTLTSCKLLGPYEEEFENQRGRIHAIKGIGINNQNLFVVKLNHRMDLLPCNLPTNYQIDSLQIIFSGKAIKFNHSDLDLAGVPTELTRLSRYSNNNTK